MYKYKLTHMYACTYTHTCKHAYIHTHICKHAYTHAHASTHTHTLVQGLIHTHACKHAHTRACKHTHAHAHYNTWGSSAKPRKNSHWILILLICSTVSCIYTDIQHNIHRVIPLHILTHLGVQLCYVLMSVTGRHEGEHLWLDRVVLVTASHNITLEYDQCHPNTHNVHLYIITCCPTAIRNIFITGYKVNFIKELSISTYFIIWWMAIGSGGSNNVCNRRGISVNFIRGTSNTYKNVH